MDPMMVVPMSVDLLDVKDAKHIAHVRIVGHGTANDTRVYLDGQEVRMCLGATLEADANGVGEHRWPVLTLRILCPQGVDVDLPANVHVVKVSPLTADCDETGG